jgi:hypothetical protein
VARLRALPDSRVLDRLVRGRGWIAIVGVGLIGIVFLQVSLLNLNAGISRAVAAAETLERQNATLRESISELDTGERISGAAAEAGMIMPSAGEVRFLDARRADGRRAAAGIRPPKPVASTVAPGLAAMNTPTGAAAAGPSGAAAPGQAGGPATSGGSVTGAGAEAAGTARPSGATPPAAAAAGGVAPAGTATATAAQGTAAGTPAAGGGGPAAGTGGPGATAGGPAATAAATPAGGGNG